MNHKDEYTGGATVFAPLPKTLQRPIAGGCSCRWCKTHPDAVPMWDTLAWHPDSRESWTVHYPDLDTTKRGQ